MDFRTRKLYDMGFLVGANEMIVSRVLVKDRKTRANVL